VSANPKVIRATYLETEEHCLRAWGRNPKKPRFWLVLCIAVPISFGVILLEEFKNTRSRRTVDWTAVLVPIVVGLLLSLWISPLGQRWQLRKSLRKVLCNPPTEAWFEFAEDGFMASGKGGQSSFHPWATVPSAVQFSEGVLIYFAEHEQSYFWIPQSAFGSPQDYEALLALVGAKVKRVEKSKR
jgi:hypothetical protein